MSKIDRFLTQIRSRQNRGLALRVLVWCLCLGMVAAFVVALVFRVRGYPVPLEAWAIPGSLALFAAFVVWVARRRSLEDSARLADAHFGLKDGLLSAYHFGREHREGEVYDLQREATEQRLDEADPESLPFLVPKRALLATVAGAAVIGWLCTLPASEAIQRKLAAEQSLQDRTTMVEEELDRFVEELINEMDEDERELVDPEALKNMVREMEGTKDEKDALRQFAKLEQEIAKAMAGLEAKQDEAVLKLAAAELQGADIGDLRQLAKMLESKDFKLAEQKLKQMKGDPKEWKERPNKAEFEKLREAMKRMNAGAQKGRFNKKGNMQQKLGQANRQMPMQQMLGELDDAAGEIDDALEELELGELEMGEFEEMDGEFDGKLGKLAGRLRKLDAKKRMRARMKGLRDKLGQCQGFAMGDSQSMMLGLAPGGLQAGVGSDASRRKERDESKDNGNMTQLKGRPSGDGPSQKAVEEADSGTGIARRSGEARERAFKKTFESFVHRDDVPEAMKAGVREYFERIHEVEVDGEGNPAPVTP